MSSEAKKLMKGLENKTYKEQLRELQFFYPEEKEAEGRPYSSLQLPENRL